MLPDLKQFANLWTLRQYPNGDDSGEWSLEEKLAAIKAAGFDGFQWFAQPEFPELAARHGLAYLGTCDADETNYPARLANFVPLKPLRINVQLANHDTRPEDAVRLWIDLVKAAEDLGLNVDLEIHRDTCTETPEKTWRIAELYGQKTGRPISLNFDLSHFAVVKHLSPPYAPRLLTHPDLLRFSRQMHLRPFNGHHCEIPLTNGQGQVTPWGQRWLEFVEETFRCWRQGKSEGETLWACPELGSLNSGYWIAPFPDPWQDVVFARGAFERLWSQMNDQSQPG